MEQAAVEAADDAELTSILSGFQPLEVSLPNEGSVADGWYIPEMDNAAIVPSDAVVQERLRQYGRWAEQDIDNMHRIRLNRQVQEAERRRQERIARGRNLPEWADNLPYRETGVYVPQYEAIDEGPTGPGISTDVPQDVPVPAQPAPYPPDTSRYGSLTPIVNMSAKTIKFDSSNNVGVKKKQVNGFTVFYQTQDQWIAGSNKARDLSVLPGSRRDEL